MKKRYFGAVIGMVLFLGTLTGCGSNNETKNSAGPAIGFVVTSDYSVGNLSTLGTTAPRTAANSVLGATGIHSDSVIRAFGNRIFIIQRLGSNSVLVIDPDNPSTPLANYTTNDPGTDAPESNPYDMAFVSLSKAYVSRYELNTLLIINPLTGEQTGTIDLSQFADSDGVVEMDQMVIVNGKLYVALQRLDRNNFFSASNDSYVVVIDTSTDTVIDTDPVAPGTQAIVLEGRNPTSRPAYLSSPDRIYLVDTGNYYTGDDYGGIEAINPDTYATDGIIMPDEAFGGSLGVFAVFSETVAYATVFDESFNNFVVPFNLSTAQVGAPLAGIGSGYLSGLAFDGDGFLYIADQDTTHPGIQVFDPDMNVKVEGPIDTGLPPVDLVFVTP